jgi:diacylglycerol kinase family enzyme
VNGRIFLHKAVIGTIPAIAAAREKVRGHAGLGALFAFGRYVVRRVNHSRRTAVAIVSRDTVDRIERVHALAIANNAYDEGWGQVFHRSRLDRGCLTLYVLKRFSVADIVRLSTKMFAGHWREDEAISVETVRSVTLNAKRLALAVMIDGEIEYLKPPLHFRIRPAALRVLAPAPSKDDAEGATDGKGWIAA